MAKKAFVVDRAKLEAALNSAEVNGPLVNRSVLFNKAAILYNADNPPREITAAVIYLRVNEWGIELKTPVGKRGRVAGVNNPDAVVQTDKPNAIAKATLPKLLKAISDQCHECVGTANEIRKCSCKDSCSLWAYRPFQLIQIAA